MTVPPQNTGVGVRCVALLSSLHFSWAFLVGYVPLLALVFLPLQSTVVVLVILTAAIYPTTSHRRFALRTHSFASFSPTISLHYILDDPLFCITKGVALLNTEEGRVNGYQGVRLMDSPTFSTSRSTCLDDLQLPVRIMTSTLLAVYFASCSIANHEHPRMAFISAASFSALHSSFRYLRSLYIIS